MSTQLFESNLAGFVRVSGEDALPYLQSQLTIDFRKLPIHGTRLGLRLSRKGRVLFGAQVIREAEEDYLLICQETPAQEVIELLAENVVADEVEFAELDGEWEKRVLYHPDSLDDLFSLTGLDPIGRGIASPTEAGWAYIDAQQPPHSLTILAPSSAVPRWLEKLAPSPSIALETIRLKAGIFRAGPEIGKEEFPQEGGLEKEAVDFDKGCYLGQEVMARIHAMGKVRNTAVAVQGSLPLASSLPITLVNEGKKVGKLKTQFPQHDGEGWIGAAVVHENALPSLAEHGLSFENSDAKVIPLNR